MPPLSMPLMTSPDLSSSYTLIGTLVASLLRPGVPTGVLLLPCLIGESMTLRDRLPRRECCRRIPFGVNIIFQPFFLSEKNKNLNFLKKLFL